MNAVRSLAFLAIAMVLSGITELEKLKSELEEQLRLQFAGQDRAAIASHPVLKVYGEYYKRFKKMYHVQLQLGSIVLKGKSIPAVASLVECMFMAEVKNMLLTAGHDLDKLQLPLTLDVTTGNESYVLLRGENQVVKAGDMMISDGLGIISNIVYGPNQRTQITAETRNVVFTVYAPAGIDEQVVRRHLQDIQEYVMVIAPQAGESVVHEFSGLAIKDSYTLRPEDVALNTIPFAEIATTGDLQTERDRFLKVLTGKGCQGCFDFTCLNAGATLYIGERAGSIGEGVRMARDAISSGAAIAKLKRWVSIQNAVPDHGLDCFERHLRALVTE